MLQFPAGFCIDEDYIVGKIVGNQQLIVSVMRDDSDASRIRDSLATPQLEEALGNELVVTDGLRSDLYEALSRDLAPIEAVNGNTIPSVTLFQTCGIGNGTE